MNLTAPQILGIILGWLVLSTTVKVTLGAVKFRSSFRGKRVPGTEILSIDDPNLDQAMAKTFKESIRVLAGCGFDFIGGIRYVHDSSSLILLANRTTRVVAIVSQDPLGRLPGMAFVEFMSRTRDGRVVRTSNSSALAMMPGTNEVVDINLPSVKQLDDLNRIHLWLFKKHIGDQEKVLRIDDEFNGDVQACMRQGRFEQSQRMLEVGYFLEDRDSHDLRATWRFAVRIIGIQFFPFKQFHHMRTTLLSWLLLRAVRRGG